MAFLSPTPLLSPATLPLPRPTLTTPLRPTPSPISAAPPPSQPTPPTSSLRDTIFPFPFRRTPSKAPREYITTSTPTPPLPDRTTLPATLHSKIPVCPSSDHIELTLRLQAPVFHTQPGQFVQLRLPTSATPSKTILATISTPPSPAPTTSITLLLNRHTDPLKLCKLPTGTSLHISPPLGTGILTNNLLHPHSDIYIFVDAPQGFAAAKSLLEWPFFRAQTGVGANRTTHVNIFYSVPHGRALPYAHRFSEWSVYGVNVIPLPATSVLEFLSDSSAVTLGKPRVPVTDCFALACVSADDTFEPLFSSLILHGFRRKAVHRFTQEVIIRDFLYPDTDSDSDSTKTTPKSGYTSPLSSPSSSSSSFSSSSSYFDSDRHRVEHQIWQSWVRVREGMRADFERKWAAQARVDREHERSAQEKQQAWASWCAKNKDQWTRVPWDSDSWRTYWSSWSDTNSKWTSSSSNSHSSKDSKYGQNGYAWDQQGSQEYWDWVSRGTGPRRSSASGNGGAGRSSYHERYGGSQTWGNTNTRWSGYQKGGYRYQYEEPSNDKSGTNTGSYNYNNGTGAGAGSGAGWSGWNRNASGRRTSSSGNRKNWNTSRHSTFGDLDFYGVLGIESGASRADIKRAYRRKAMEHHPDRNPEKSEEAHMKMKQIVVAWSVLKDDDKRRKYDSFGPGGL